MEDIQKRRQRHRSRRGTERGRHECVCIQICRGRNLVGDDRLRHRGREGWTSKCGYLVEKEPQSAKKRDGSQSDRLREVMSEHDGATIPLPLSFSSSVFLSHIPPLGPVPPFFPFLGNFPLLPQKQPSAKMTSLALEATRPSPDQKRERRGRRGGLADRSKRWRKRTGSKSEQAQMAEAF